MFKYHFSLFFNHSLPVVRLFINTDFFPVIQKPSCNFMCQVVDFCDGASSQRPHNSVAPTKQNLFCGGRSVWEIMMQHEDFADGR